MTRTVFRIARMTYPDGHRYGLCQVLLDGARVLEAFVLDLTYDNPGRVYGLVEALRAIGEQDPIVDVDTLQLVYESDEQDDQEWRLPL